jgi:hypothetical protein
MAEAGPVGAATAAPWLATLVPEGGPDWRRGALSDSVLALRAMAVEGMGRAILPCILGEPEPCLMRHGDPLAEAAVPVWVAAPAALAGTSRAAEAARVAHAAVPGRARWNPPRRLPRQALRHQPVGKAEQTLQQDQHHAERDDAKDQLDPPLGRRVPRPPRHAPEMPQVHAASGPVKRTLPMKGRLRLRWA